LTDSGWRLLDLLKNLLSSPLWNGSVTQRD
jgi:hypothetical protein